MKILCVRILTQDFQIIQECLGGHDVLNAPDIEEALVYLGTEQDISLLVIDLDVPDSHVFQLIKKVNCDSRYAQVRTIILTREDQLGDEIIGLKFGANDYVHKPINMESLRAHVEMQLDVLKKKGSQTESSCNESSNVIFGNHQWGLQYPLKVNREARRMTLFR